jgi:hypothetical protein
VDTDVVDLPENQSRQCKGFRRFPLKICRKINPEKWIPESTGGEKVDNLSTACDDAIASSQPKKWRSGVGYLQRKSFLCEVRRMKRISCFTLETSYFSQKKWVGLSTFSTFSLKPLI